MCVRRVAAPSPSLPLRLQDGPLHTAPASTQQPAWPSITAVFTCAFSRRSRPAPRSAVNASFWGHSSAPAWARLLWGRAGNATWLGHLRWDTTPADDGLAAAAPGEQQCQGQAAVFLAHIWAISDDVPREIFGSHGLQVWQSLIFSANSAQIWFHGVFLFLFEGPLRQWSIVLVRHMMSNFGLFLACWSFHTSVTWQQCSGDDKGRSGVPTAPPILLATAAPAKGCKHYWCLVGI